MKVEYKFVDGTVIEVEVEESIGTVITELNYHRLKAGGLFRAKAQILRLKVALQAKACSFLTKVS